MSSAVSFSSSRPSSQRSHVSERGKELGHQLLGAIKKNAKVDEVFKQIHSDRIAENIDPDLIYPYVYRKIEGLAEKDLLKIRINAVFLRSLFPKSKKAKGAETEIEDKILLLLFSKDPKAVLQKIAKKATLAERLKLYTKLAAHHGMLLINHLEMLNLKGATSAQLLELYCAIASTGEKEAMCLIELFGCLGLENANPDDRLLFCKYLASCGNGAETCLNTCFSSLGFIEHIRTLHSANRTAYCKALCQEGSWAAVGLAANFEKLGLKKIKIESRLELCGLIAASGEPAQATLSQNFINLGIYDSNECATNVERIYHCKFLVAQGEWAARALADNFQLLQIETSERALRHDLCIAIAETGESAAASLANNFASLGLMTMPTRGRLLLCTCIASKGLKAGTALFRQFDTLGIERASIDERIELCNQFVPHHTQSVHQRIECLADNFQQLGFLRDVNDCEDMQAKLVLCSKLAKRKWGARGLKKHFQQIGIIEEFNECIDSERKTHWLKQTILLGGWAAESLLTHLSLIDLEDIVAATRLELCKMIAVQSEEAARKLVGRLPDFDLGEFQPSERVDLAVLVAEQGEKVAIELVDHFENLGLINVNMNQMGRIAATIEKQGQEAANAVQSARLCERYSTELIVDAFA